jgi:molybdopterin-guanine dinucleotide biosynthesis protein A
MPAMISRVSRIRAIVLAGGASRRMGQSKALLVFEGEPLLSRAVRNVAFASEVVVVAQPGQALPLLDQARVVRDSIPDAGPLVGLWDGLRAFAHAHPDEWIFVCATDSPYVSRAVVERLAALGDDGYDAVIPEVAGKKHVLTALYRARVVERARALVDSGVRRASALSEGLRTKFATAEELLADPQVRTADPALRTLLNVNTPDDLSRLR